MYSLHKSVGLASATSSTTAVPLQMLAQLRVVTTAHHFMQSLLAGSPPDNYSTPAPTSQAADNVVLAPPVYKAHAAKASPLTIESTSDDDNAQSMCKVPIASSGMAQQDTQPSIGNVHTLIYILQICRAQGNLVSNRTGLQHLQIHPVQSSSTRYRLSTNTSITMHEC